MIIEEDILEKACKDMIETILLCLRDATKGTIYRVGPMPRLQAVRVTSGMREDGSDQIQWGLPEASDYNYPGKNWEQYRDRAGHVMEAMGWCVEKQKSWTADNPYEDLRSVRKQLLGEIEDFHHMEPVLVRKAYLYGDQAGELDYPLDALGKPIWCDCEYVVVAVIKIHFRSYKIRRGDRSTKIIKKLSRTLGTELLSLHIRETLSQAQKELARQRLQSCNVLAHELRNTLMKLGLLFSAINAEISYLRESWEGELERALPDLDSKSRVLQQLNRMIQKRLPFLDGAGKLAELGEELLAEQKELMSLALMPQAGARWIENKIQPKWHRLLLESHEWDADREEVQRLLELLEKVLWVGTDETLAMKVEHIPEDLRKQWPKLAYVDFTKEKLVVLDEILEFLDHPALALPHKQQSKKVLTFLKALVSMIPEVEKCANRIIYSLKNGGACEGL